VHLEKKKRAGMAVVSGDPRPVGLVNSIKGGGESYWGGGGSLVLKIATPGKNRRPPARKILINHQT